MRGADGSGQRPDRRDRAGRSERCRRSAAAFAASTHFNPVVLACACATPRAAVRSRSATSIPRRSSSRASRRTAASSRRSSGPACGTARWRDWKTVFVEVPEATFTPVKTVNDLLRPAHQPRRAEREGRPTWTPSSSPAAPASSARTSSAWRSRETDGARRRARQADLRRQPARASPTCGATRASPSCRATSPTARLVDRALRRAPADVGRQLRRREPRRPLDRRPARLRRDQHRRHLRAARRRARLLRASSTPTARERFRFLHVSTDEVYGSLGADRALHRDDAVRAELALLRLEGGRRPPGARLPRHLRAADADHQLLEQLRPVPVSREADPADDPQRARGQPLPIYGDGGNVRDWLYVEDHCAGILLVLERGQAGRDVQHRRRATSARNLAAGRPPLRTARRARAGRAPTRRCAAKGLGRYADLKTLRRRPARPRPALRHRRQQDPPRARLDAAPRLRVRPRARRCAGTSPTAPGARPCRRAATGASASAATVAARRAERAARRARSHHAQGHHPRRRLRHAAVSADARGQQAAAAGLRQADDLLSAVDADAGRHPRDPGDHDAARPGGLPAPARRRRRARACDIQYAAQPQPGGPRAGVPDRRDVHRRRRASPWSSATTSSTATASRTMLRRAAARDRRRDRLRLPGARSGALRRGRVRRARAGRSASRRSRRSRARPTP